ncbi:MAG: type 4a pilus biogenesis protein PilO [Nitrospirae bacterium]|nr:type 4a pilus biogenesis protein PilO [Fimbriimonadaceae bacterium]
MKISADNPEKMWTVMVWIGLALFSVAIYFVVFPIKTEPVDMAKFAEDATKLKAENADLEQEIVSEKERFAASVWTGKLDELGPSALGHISALAKESGVVVTAFRPQRLVEDTAVAQYPLLITCEGRYPSMINFVRRLENVQGKLAVNLVQLSAADGATDQVTGSIGVVAFYEVAAAEARTASTAKTREGGTRG